MKTTSGLDVRALKIFEAVASSGSLSKGAAALGVTQSAVSQTITQIEAILQTQVFDRSQRPFKLTPAGIALSRRAGQIEREAEDTRVAQRLEQCGGHGKYAVACSARRADGAVKTRQLRGWLSKVIQNV